MKKQLDGKNLPRIFKKKCLRKRFYKRNNKLNYTERKAVIMDKSLKIYKVVKASINNAENFKRVSLETPKSRRRPPKHYHLLLRKQRELDAVLEGSYPKK